MSAPTSWRSDGNAAFCAGLQNVQLPYPTGLKAWHGQGVEKRFQVYRNNIYSGLIDALAAQFPVTHQLVGDEFFRGMALLFTENNLPKTPKLFEYGADFPEFVAEFEPANSVPYLADMARFEWLWNNAYHAAEATPIDAQALAQIPAEFMGDVQFTFHPSLQLFTSTYPIISVWLAHQTTPNEIEITAGAESALIVRPEASVLIIPLSHDMLEFIRCLHQGNTLAEAIDVSDNIDISEVLAILLRNDCITTYTIRAHP